MKKKSIQPINLVHECGQIAIIDSEIFIQIYFEVGRNSAQNESYLETLGCLGLVLRDNCNDESGFNPADIRETLFALLHDKGK